MPLLDRYHPETRSILDRSIFSRSIYSSRSDEYVYLLRDLFTTNRGAGTVNGTPAEPGPGTRNVNDTGNNLSIAGSRLVTAGIVAAGNPRLVYSPAIVRTGGTTAKWTHRWTQARGGGGWCTSATPTAPQYGIWDASAFLCPIPPSLTGYVTFTTGVDYTIWAVLHAAGGAIFAQGGGGAYTYANPTLLWVDNNAATDPMYFAPQVARAVSCALESDDVEVTIQGQLASPQIMATVYQTSPATGVGYVADAEGLYHLTYTRPGAPGGGDDLGIQYRIQDVNNYWHAYIEWGGAAWDFRLDRVTAGVPANQITVAGIGNTTDVVVVTAGATHQCFTRNTVTGLWTKRGATITDAAFQAATEINSTFTAGTADVLRAFARTWGLT